MTVVASASLIIQGGMLFDGTGQPPRENVTIVIADEQIRQISPEPVSLPSATVIQASGLTIVPGLIDLHVHQGIWWIISTGSSWRDLPTRFGPWQTVFSRYQRWRKEGRWTRMLQVFQEQQPLSSA